MKKSTFGKLVLLKNIEKKVTFRILADMMNICSLHVVSWSLMWNVFVILGSLLSNSLSMNEALALARRASRVML